MKIVSKFKLELPLSWQALVPLGHDILLGLMPSFPLWIKLSLNYFSGKIIVMILRHELRRWHC
jgi:hypothetical protein